MIGKQYEYEAMAKCEEDLWWYKRLHELTFREINQVADKNAAILDAGCGTGGMLTFLRTRGFTNMAGFDLSPEAIEYSISKGCLNVRLLDILDSDTSYPLNSFDVIISHDILCLLEDGNDKLAFDKLLSLLKPGGTLLMNLPAGRLFKGTHDYAVGIKKRYSKKSISALATSGTVEIREHRWPYFLSPVIFSVRLLQRAGMFYGRKKSYQSDVRLPHPVLNSFFYKLTSMENRISFATWGSSIFVTIRKL